MDLGAPVTLNADNNWHYEWTGLKKNKNGQRIVYSVDETTVLNDYAKSVSFTNNNGSFSYTITNIYARIDATLSAKKAAATLSAKKAANSNLGNKSFQFVLADGEGNVIETSAAVKQNQSVTFASIPYTLADAGKTYTYQIYEKLPEGVNAEDR